MKSHKARNANEYRMADILQLLKSTPLEPLHMYIEHDGAQRQLLRVLSVEAVPDRELRVAEVVAALLHDRRGRR